MWDKISIYLAKIDPQLNPEYINYLLQYVSEEKKERFYKFRFMEDGLRSLYGEIIVRSIISKQFAISRDQIEIEKNNLGKPVIRNLPIHFNISHSEEWVACAISQYNIGIDIEKIKAAKLNIAERFFNEKEYRFLAKMEGEKQEGFFYDIWTLKESYVKWLGSGLQRPLNSFYFDISDTQISVIDKEQKEIPFFRQYPVEGYKLSICAATSDFPDYVNVIKLHELIPWIQ